MPSKHSYYPIARDGSIRQLNRDSSSTSDSDRSRLSWALERSATPELDSRSSSPSSSSSSGPPTPRLHSLVPVSSKMGRRTVNFASPIADSYRQPGWDELSVMRAYASHATHCASCADPMGSLHEGDGLCDRGKGLAKDLGTYFYCYHGKPHSHVDKRNGREKIQVEVPHDYRAVTSLFGALDKGMKLTRPKSSRPKVHQTPPDDVYESTRSPAASKPISRRHTVDFYSSQPQAMVHDDYYDIRPARSDTRRRPEPIYRGLDGRLYETRAPDNGLNSTKRNSRTYPTSLSTSSRRDSRYTPRKSYTDSFLTSGGYSAYDAYRTYGGYAVRPVRSDSYYDQPSYEYRSSLRENLNSNLRQNDAKRRHSYLDETYKRRASSHPFQWLNMFAGR